MIKAIIDTHAIIWFLYSDPRLSAKARAFMMETFQQENAIGISAISFVEIVYLIEKGRIPAETLSSLIAKLDESNKLLVEVQLDIGVARTLARVDSAQIPDMPDRIVAATALHLNVPVISRDGRIRLSTLETIW